MQCKKRNIRIQYTAEKKKILVLQLMAYSPVVAWHTTRFNIRKFVLTVYLCVLYGSLKKKSSYYFPVLPWLVLIILTECVYCAVWAASLNVSNSSQIPPSKTVPWLSHFRRQLHNAEARFRSQVSTSEFCGGHCGSGSDFFTEYFGFPLWILFHQYPIHIYMLLLPVVQADEAREPWKEDPKRRDNW